MNNIALVIDTNSNYSDVWPPCFGRLEKYCSNIKKYAFTDSAENIPENITPIIYDNEASYRNQILSCIKQVKEEFIIYTSEDYILYDSVNLEEIYRVCKVLSKSHFSFCKLIKGPELTMHLGENLYVIEQQSHNLFAQQASIWKTRKFEQIFQEAPPENTRMQHEPQGSELCRRLNITGLQYYSGTPKRGLHHHDSGIYPYIATAVVKGKWNITEYPEEMRLVSAEYNIDFNKRGTR
tara:strand:- start:137 stop:847 length:711 start_codon:yes stop_codon:yes gene_type:complete